MCLTSRNAFVSTSSAGDVRTWYGGDLAGTFIDEIDIKGPLGFFLSQASATVEVLAPTCHQNGFARLLLPLGGDGHVSALLGWCCPRLICLRPVSCGRPDPAVAGARV